MQRTRVDTKTETEDTTTEDQCEECGSTDIQDHTNEIICNCCGLVIEERNIDRGPEWRAFNQQEREEKKRTGSPRTLTMHDHGLTTVIGNDDVGGSNKRKEQLKRMKEWDKRCKQTSKERGLKFSLAEINRITSALDLPRGIKEKSAKWFRDAHDEGLVKGRSYEGVAAAAVYVACREDGFPRTFEEVKDVARVEQKKVQKSYQKLNRELGIQIIPPDPQNFVSRFVNDVQQGVDHIPVEKFRKLENATRCYVRNTKEEGGHSGRDPASVVAGSMYLAARNLQLDLTQTDIAENTPASEIAVRSSFNKQRDIFGIENLPSAPRKCPKYDVEGIGEVRGKYAKIFAEELVKWWAGYVDTRVKRGHTVDFIIDDTFAVDVQGGGITADKTRMFQRDFPEYTYIVLGEAEWIAKELEGGSADHWVTWEKHADLAEKLENL